MGITARAKAEERIAVPKRKSRCAPSFSPQPCGSAGSVRGAEGRNDGAPNPVIPANQAACGAGEGSDRAPRRCLFWARARPCRPPWDSYARCEKGRRADGCAQRENDRAPHPLPVAKPFAGAGWGATISMMVPPAEDATLRPPWDSSASREKSRSSNDGAQTRSNRGIVFADPAVIIKKWLHMPNVQRRRALSVKCSTVLRVLKRPQRLVCRPRMINPLLSAFRGQGVSQVVEHQLTSIGSSCTAFTIRMSSVSLRG
jgi:hypothetical protein